VIERRSFGPYALLTLLAPDIAAVAVPGQFVMVALPGSRFRLRRPLSLHSVDGERVRLLVEPRGEGTRELAELGIADTLAVAGPLGHGFPLDRVHAALLVAGGIGVAPFQFVADVLRARGIPVTATFGFRDEGQARLAGAFEIDDLWVATDDGSVGRPGPPSRRRTSLGERGRLVGLCLPRSAHGLRQRRLSRLRRGDSRGLPAGLRRRPGVRARPSRARR
jgi:NAD(P)H-flavin reductase